MKLYFLVHLVVLIMGVLLDFESVQVLQLLPCKCVGNVLIFGKPNSTMFDEFRNELQMYLDETTLAVDERKHEHVMHMPLPISIRHLQELIEERLKRSTDSTPTIPTQEWIYLQFWPSNPYSEAALRHTGWFKVKFGVQVRQLHKDHPDRHYVSALLKLLRALPYSTARVCY